MRIGMNGLRRPSRLGLLLCLTLAAASLGCEEGGGEADAGESPREDAGPSGLDAGAGDAGAGDAGAGDAGAGDAGPPDAGPIGSAGCVDGEGLAEGEHTFMLEGLERRFLVRLPNGYTADRSWPLVLALHGNGSGAEYWDSTRGARNIRGVLQDEAVLLIAEAIDHQWRDYSMPAESWPPRIESELAYFDELLRRARESLCINEEAIFAMGFSGGGSFSGVLGCRRTDIRAIAVGGSVIYFDPADCVGAPAAWITIGELELSAGREAYRDYFRDRAGCLESSAPTSPDPCVAYEGCGAGTPVHYCQHPGDHIWPDFASEAMWSFFSSQIE